MTTHSKLYTFGIIKKISEEAIVVNKGGTFSQDGEYYRILDIQSVTIENGRADFVIYAKPLESQGIEVNQSC